MNHCIEYKIAERMFPKKCRNCEKTYDNLDDFCAMTTLPKSGEDYVEDTRGKMIFRNCGCGSTLLIWERSRSYLEYLGLRSAL